MKTFVYIAKDSGGSEVHGKVKAENLDQAIANIRANDLRPTALGELKGEETHENEDTCRKPKSYFLKRILAAIGKKLIETSER